MDAPAAATRIVRDAAAGLLLDSGFLVRAAATARGLPRVARTYATDRGRRKRDMLRLRRPLRSASTLLLFGSARSFSLLGPLSSSRLRPPCNLRVRCQASIPDSEEGWRAVLSPSQFSVLRNAATEPSGYSENKEGELEYKLKTELKTKYPADGAYWYASQRG